MTKKSLRGKLFAAVGGALAAYSLAAASFASLIVNFKPVPVSPNIPELQWTGSNLVASPLAAGSTGNADGGSPPNTQTQGGLQIETPFTSAALAAVAGSSVNVGANSTTFYDVTLELFGLQANANAVSFAGITVQSFGEGRFILSSTADANGAKTTLLEGSIARGVVNGLSGSTSGAVLSDTLTYTGGAIATAGGLIGTSGSLSFSMLDIAPPLATGPDATSGFNTLTAFGANATGLFSAVPEPTAAMLLAIGTVGLGLRNRSRKE
jgi:hypothetical protein